MSIIKKILFLVLIIFVSLAIYSGLTIKNSARITYIRWLPGNLLAVTIPPIGIFIKNEYINEGDARGSIIAHEKIHWIQYQEFGLWKFYINYYAGFIKYGRFKAPMEVDARTRSL